MFSSQSSHTWIGGDGASDYLRVTRDSKTNPNGNPHGLLQREGTSPGAHTTTEGPFGHPYQGWPHFEERTSKACLL